jgi:hypothetical protein
VNAIDPSSAINPFLLLSELINNKYLSADYLRFGNRSANLIELDISELPPLGFFSKKFEKIEAHRFSVVCEILNPLTASWAKYTHIMLEDEEVAFDFFKKNGDFLKIITPTIAEIKIERPDLFSLASEGYCLFGVSGASIHQDFNIIEFDDVWWSSDPDRCVERCYKMGINCFAVTLSDHGIRWRVFDCGSFCV